MTGTDTAGLAKAVDQILDDSWGRPHQAASADLDALWSIAAAQGWFELSGSLEDALTIVRGTGRHACPLPVLDAFVAGEVLTAHPDLVLSIGLGVIRVVLGTPDPGSGATYVEAGAVATHVLTVPAGEGEAALHPVVAAEPVPGLAVPAWCRVTLADPTATVPLDVETADRAAVLHHLGLAVRALAAAEHSHELALARARTRKQFGRTIGSYGPVQRRLVDSHVELAASDLLIAEAARRHRTPGWRLAAQLAVVHARRVAPRVQSAAHHTLAAVGYFEQHDAPWLFRRVHADLAWLAATPAPRGDVAEALLDDGADLPDPLLGSEADAARTRFRRLLADRGPWPEATVTGRDHPDAVAALGADGWFSMGWPTTAGGQGACPAAQSAVQQEVFHHRLPVTSALAAAMTVGGVIARHGTPEQRADLLPRIARGELSTAVGYSEPEAGSDLAALRTRAVRDGDHWVITGRKAWASDAHRARHLWLAARTDPDAVPAQAGITLFLLAMDSPGIGVIPDIGLSGQVACEITLDAVRVPDTARVGPVNGGRRVLNDALGSERVLLGGMAATAHHRPLHRHGRRQAVPRTQYDAGVRGPFS
ncbi:acyl-CoA dehydrogenase, partial [Streptomyces sp. NPDC047072]|uniref:acyl-CoA dehydrogenase n=1 Tax=Streptomyces sp. NPDC047072 TaxID=3154809 RepID=UPI0033FC122C